MVRHSKGDFPQGRHRPSPLISQTLLQPSPLMPQTLLQPTLLMSQPLLQPALLTTQVPLLAWNRQRLEKST